MAVHPAESRPDRYDTPECRLARWGVGLWRDGACWVVELPRLERGILATRHHFEFVGTREQPPDDALDLLAAFTRGASLARVFEVDAPAPAELPEPPVGDASPAAVIRRALAASVSRWIQHDPGVRLGLDAEDVHQARVATRRMRSDLGSFESLLDPGWARALRADLRPFAAALGAVRDLDVLYARLGERVGRLDDAEGRNAAELCAALADERERARADLLARMRTPEYLALLDRCLGAAREPALLAGADTAASDALGQALRARWRRLERDVKQAGDEPSPGVLHAIRIRAKRCRYAAEALIGVDGKGVRALARALARLQDVLGEHQDAMIASDWLRRASARATDDERFVAGLLAGAELSAAEAARREWRRAWRRARDCAARAELR